MGCLFILISLSLGTNALARAPSDDLQPGQSLGISMGLDRMPNLRDLGGYSTRDGKVVVRGQVYRSNEFYPLDRNDLAKLEKLHLKTDYDLRTPAEILLQPDTIPPGVNYIELNVMAGEDLIISPATIDELMLSPVEASKKWGGTKGVEETFKRRYRDFISLPSAHNAYQTLFLSLSQSTSLPGVFHCTNGKDRTGWGAAALLTLLGVSREEVFSDYLRSNAYLLPLHQKQSDKFIAGGGDPGIPGALFGVKQSYLQAAFDEMHSRYGTIDRYFSEGLKIDLAQQKKIGEMYLTNKLDD
jgi:protein-tyrosine phosphatase